MSARPEPSPTRLVFLSFDKFQSKNYFETTCSVFSLQLILTKKITESSRKRATANRSNAQRDLVRHATRSGDQSVKRVHAGFERRSMGRVDERDESEVHGIKRLAFNRRTIELSERDLRVSSRLAPDKRVTWPRALHRRGEIEFFAYDNVHGIHRQRQTHGANHPLLSFFLSFYSFFLFLLN